MRSPEDRKVPSHSSAVLCCALSERPDPARGAEVFSLQARLVPITPDFVSGEATRLRQAMPETFDDAFHQWENALDVLSSAAKAEIVAASPTSQIPVCHYTHLDNIELMRDFGLYFANERCPEPSSHTFFRLTGKVRLFNPLHIICPDSEAQVLRQGSAIVQLILNIPAERLNLGRNCGSPFIRATDPSPTLPQALRELLEARARSPRGNPYDQLKVEGAQVFLAHARQKLVTRFGPEVIDVPWTLAVNRFIWT